MPDSFFRSRWYSWLGGVEGERLDRMITRADQAISSLEAATATATIWNGLTAAQRQEQTRLAIVALTKMARLLLNRLEAE